MMELLKKHIHMNRRRGNVTSQMTLDDDFNVPDSMDDVEELIMENGEVKIESVKNPGEKAEISDPVPAARRRTHSSCRQHPVYGDRTYAGACGE